MAFRMTGSKRPLTSAGSGGDGTQPMWHRDASRRPPWRGGLPAPYVLPAGFAALLAVGTVAAALGGRLGATGVLIACAVVVGVLAALAEPTAAIPLGVIGWLTAVGFSRPPYADLRLTGVVAGRAAVTLAAGGGRRGRRGRGVPLARGRSHTRKRGPARAQRALPAQAGGRRGTRRGRAAAAHRAAQRAPAAPQPLRRPADLPGRGGRGHGRRRLLARRGRRGRRLPAAELVLHRAAAHVHHRRAAQPARARAVRHGRGRGEQRGPPGRAARGGRGAQLEGDRVAARPRPDRARRRGHPRRRARPPDGEPRRPCRAPGARGRPLDQGGVASGELATPPIRSDAALRGAARPGPRGQRAGGERDDLAARRVHRAGRRRPRPGPAAHPGGAGRGARGRRPDADRAAARGEPRPAHPAGVDQGERVQPAADRRALVGGGRGRAARQHRAERRPARRARRQPARHEPPAGRVA